MFEKLEVFRMASAMAIHAGTRQAVVSENIANADTPGYKARDISPFAQAYQSNSHASTQRATRDQHLHGMQSGSFVAFIDADQTETSPNENSVSIEMEMMRAVDVKRQHDRALAIYKSAMSVLRTSVGRS